MASCASGVDCSGFVSQAWGSSYHTTHVMHAISAPIDPSALIPGDALNKKGSHVRLVEKNLGNSVMVVDRVIRRELGWGDNSGYQAVRYNNHCGYYSDSGEQPQPPPPPPPGGGGEQPPPVDPLGLLDWHFRDSLDGGPADIILP